jgi:hypothetical protein
MFYRLVWFLVVVITAAVGPLFIYIAVTLGYLFMYMGIEVVLVAFCIDGYFGYGRGLWPWYTLGTLIALIVVRLVRPYISLYNR